MYSKDKYGQENNDINICFSSDDNYATYMSTAMISILKNATKDDNYNFYILDGGITFKKKKLIEKLKEIKPFKIQYFEIDKNEFIDCPMTKYVKYITIPTYYRFKIPSILNNLDKVLYLDCDIILEDNIRYLYDINIDDYYIAAAPEVFNHHHKDRLKIQGDDYYCNAGVLIINNKKWRKDSIEEKLFNYAKNPDIKIIFQDQDVINAVLKYKIKYLPLKWNLQHDALFHNDSYIFHKKERMDAIEKPSLVHFTHKYKPWSIKCKNKYQKSYLKYLKISPNKNEYYKLMTLKFIICFLKSMFSIKNEGKYRIVRFLGLKIKFKTKFNTIMEELRQNKEAIKHITSEICEIKSHIEWMNHPLYCIDNGVNTIFRYMTGLQLTKDYQTERIVTFEPTEAPIDHIKRYSFIQKFINKNDTVLDIACGVGYGSALLAKNAKEVIGVDINEPSINFANKIFKETNLSFVCFDATTFKIEDVKNTERKSPQNEGFDKIVSFETIEHLIEDKKLVSNFYNLLKEGGKLFCSVPNETVFPYHPKVVPFHIKHYTIKEIKELLTEVGFEIEDTYFQYKEDNHNIDKKEKEGYTIICIAKK